MIMNPVAFHGTRDPDKRYWSQTMINPDGSPHTAHTTNPVPIILIDKDIKEINDGILGDIAPTILKLIGVEQPKAMTQKTLI